MSDNYHEINLYNVMWPNDPQIAEYLESDEYSIEEIASTVTELKNIQLGEDEGILKLVEEFGINEGDLATKLNAGFNHIIKTTGKNGSEFRVYDPNAGVWVCDSGELANGQTPAQVIDELLQSYEKVAQKSARLLESVINITFPPQARPSSKDQVALQFYLARENVIKGLKKISSSALNLASNLRGKSYKIFMNQWQNIAQADETTWDSEMRWLVCKDVTVDLQLVRSDFSKRVFECVVPHSPKHMSTNKVNATAKYLNIDYVYGDESDLPTESKFITGVARTLPDESIREFMQARFGVALYGTPGEFGKAMVWQFGESDTAKSSIQEVIAGQNGVFSEYSWTGNSTVLCTGNGAASDTEANRFKAKSRGKRYVLINELDDGARLSQSTVKSLTGGDTVYGDTKYGSEVNYSFTATIFMASNHGPRLPEGDTALASRILVVPFEHHYWVQEKNPKKWLEDPENRANPSWVDDVLSNDFERSMILLWVLEGARKYFYLDTGKEIPEAIQKAGDKFKNSADIVAQTVMTILGLNDDADGVRQSYRIYSNEEWNNYGHLESDGTLVADFKKVFEMTLIELGLDDDYVIKHMKKYTDSAVKYIDEKFDARLRTIRLPNGGRRLVFTRMRPFTSNATVSQQIEDEQTYSAFIEGIDSL